MKCYIHPEADSTGTCVRCGRPVCSECAASIDGNIVCRQCSQAPVTGTIAYGTAPATKKDPVVALLLSLIGGLVSGLLIGLGQIYNGQVKKGLILIFGNLILGGVLVAGYVLISIFTLGVGAFCCLPILFIPLISWIYAVYDAYTTAERINRGEVVEDWFE
ncbi:hypothetical protein CUJ83_09495 [Methanocella sp. CWC-04]|uniref:B box-type domain-containing protein n=1 Tax=Methanooceanicella nereidis TaxID=2052831 RepID=A0AAP2RCW4_9EURY|nr:hypothetical protein [Methanocella sp. CWC-04]MCD1295231.1 hypothetical protein [Methanocella sp. CWC-04]